MEKRIKTLYIITIIAIVAFLGMQAYWLYGRYEFSLSEYESVSYGEIIQAIAELNEGRPDHLSPIERPLSHHANYKIHTNTDSIGTVSRSATIITQKYSAHELLGIKEKRKLTKAETDSVVKMVMDDEELADTHRRTYDASDAPSDAAIWAAFKNIEAEFLFPLRAEDIDSALRTQGLDSEVLLIVTDSLQWYPSILRHATVFDPTVIVSVPYSELEKKSAVVSHHLPVAKIFRSMAGSLVIVALLSLFLIVCLVLQFSTVLKLSRIEKMRTGFITTMIHELKRPISTLKMCVSAIDNKKMMADKEVEREVLAETRTALDILSAYFSRLRDITFNNVEQIPLNIRSVNLHGLVDDVVGTAAFPADKTVVINNNIDAAVDVSVDRTHFFNIINNLVENAIKYSGDSVEINVSATGNKGNIQLRISDNGNGISDKEVAHIFTRFYRGSASASETPGMGLGLTYVKLLVEAHGGTVEVESQKGEGSVFTISIPQ